MALENCLECKKEISSYAKTCVHCGYPLSREATASKKDPKFKQEPPFEITGNEKWSIKTFSLWLSAFMMIVVGLTIIVVSLELYKYIGKYSSPTDLTIWTFVILSIAAITTDNIFEATPYYKRKIKERNSLYEYLQKRFDTIADIDFEKHEKIDTFIETDVTKKENVGTDELMYSVYMRAYLKNADAIFMDRPNNGYARIILIKYK